MLSFYPRKPTVSVHKFNIPYFYTCVCHRCLPGSSTGCMNILKSHQDTLSPSYVINAQPCCQEAFPLCQRQAYGKVHYSDVIMGAIASQITSFTIADSTVYSDADQRKYQSSASLTFSEGNSPGTGEFPAQMGRKSENVSIWWRHHVGYR